MQLYQGGVARSESLGACGNATPKGFEPLRAEPNGFLVHLHRHSDTVSCVLRPSGDNQMRGCRHTTQQARPRLWVMSQAREPPRRSARGARARLAVGGALRFCLAESLLASLQTGNAKSLCFQGRCLEDVREDVHFTASSWKT